MYRSFKCLGTKISNLVDKDTAELIRAVVVTAALTAVLIGAKAGVFG